MSTGGRRARPLLPGTLAILAAGVALALAAASARAAPPGSPAPRIRILAPSDNAVVVPGEICVIGAFPGEGNAIVQVAVDGKLAKFVTATGGGFWCRLQLPPGRHAIRVASGKDEATLAVSASAPGEYRYHPQVETCEGCHARPGGRFRPDVPPARLCGKCHAPRDARKFVHGPVATGACTACHDPHGARHPRLQKAAIPCFACHQPFPAAARVHEPLARGACVSCHNPHSADDRTLLAPPGNALCASCHRESHPLHTTVAKQGAMTRIPEGFSTENGVLACAGCHAAHQSNEAHLLRVAEDRLCRECHG